MSLTVSPLTRTFTFKGTTLPDPNPASSLDTVRELLAQTHPEIANAALDGPKQVGGVMQYTFVQSVGTKG